MEVFAHSIVSDQGAFTVANYGDAGSWVVWKFDGTIVADQYTMISNPAAETMKLGVGYWFQTNYTNVVWDNTPDGSETWYVKTAGTVAADGSFHSDLNDADVAEFRIVNTLTDSGITNLLATNQDILLGNPFPSDMQIKDLYVSCDSGASYQHISVATCTINRVYISDITTAEAQPYQAITSGTPGFGGVVPPKEGAWFLMKGASATYGDIRFALPLEK